MTIPLFSKRPVKSASRPRFDALDILRGLAILGIFFINLPFMVQSPMDGSEIYSAANDFSGTVDWLKNLFLDGTQRGILQMLFGAGMILLTARAMQANGPVGVADAYFRRNLWLFTFGLLHVFIVLWPYDILHVYALAALFLFPFRLLSAPAALLLGVGFAVFTLCSNGLVDGSYGPETLMDPVMAPSDGASYAGLAGDAIKIWFDEIDGLGLWRSIAEAFCAMLIGVALFKWGVIQGLRSRRFYFVMILLAYLVGLGLRINDLSGHGFETIDTSEIARLAVTVGHIALVNLALQSRAGRCLLHPFKSAGRTAFSLYLMQSVVGIWILFSPWGIAAGRDLDPAQLTTLAVLIAAAQLVLANLWLRYFASGPVEWLWRKLANSGSHSFRKGIPARPQTASAGDNSC